MKRIGIFLLLILLLPLVAACSEQEVSTLRHGAVFGSFTALDLQGNEVNEKVFGEKKLTMVNIWGTFCSPCVEEMPDLAELGKEYKDRFQVIGIVADAVDRNGNVSPEKKREAAELVRTVGADYRHLLPCESWNRGILKEISSVPVTVFVDENGNQIGERHWGSKKKAEWERVIRVLLESLE